MRTWLVFAGLFAFSPALAQVPLLPEGPAKHTVESACATCHALTQVTGAGHSPEDWDAVVRKMVNAGAQVRADQIPIIVDYLAKNFPPKTLPP
jgi:hypothetical protein